MENTLYLCQGKAMRLKSKPEAESLGYAEFTVNISR